MSDFDLPLFPASAWGGPKKVDAGRFRVSPGDRFIPERPFDQSQLTMRSLRWGGFFETSPPDDVNGFLFKDAFSQHMLGVSMEEGKKGGILFHPTVSPSQLSYPRNLAKILSQRDYQVESSVERRLDAPGFVNNFYYRTFAGMGNKFVVALEREGGHLGPSVYDLFGMFLGGETSHLRSVGVSSDPVTYMQWLNQDDLFIGFQSGSFNVIELASSSSPVSIRVGFNSSGYVLQQGVPDLGEVVGASYLGSSKKLVVAFSRGKLLRFEFQAQAQAPVVEVYPLADEMISFELSPSQSHLAVGTRHHGVLVYEWPKLKLAFRIPVKEDSAVKALAWHPKRPWLAVGTGRTDHRLMVYSVIGQKKFFERDVNAQVTDLAWSESGTELVGALGYLADPSTDELHTSLLVWAVVEDGIGIEMKRLEGFPEVKGRALSISLDTSESLGRLFTRIRILASEGDGTVVSLRYSRVQPKKERASTHSSAAGGGAFGGSGLIR